MAEPVSLIKMWYDALATKVGIRIKTPDPGQLKAALYKARAKLGDPALKELTIYVSRSNPQEEIWIVQKGAEANG